MIYLPTLISESKYGNILMGALERFDASLVRLQDSQTG